MLAGHYAVSYVMKKNNSSIPLWHLFLAVQLMDIFWGIFILLGIEKADMHSTLAGTPIRLYYMPYTHSLAGSLCLSCLTYLVYRFWLGRKIFNRNRAALVLGMAVFSHWVCDLIVHENDLPLIGNLFKVGFGLYQSAFWSYLLEAVLLVFGLVLYLRSADRQEPTGKMSGRWSMALIVLILLGINALAAWGPKPPSEQFVAVFNLVYYLTFAWVIARWERKHRFVSRKEEPILARPIPLDMKIK